VTPSLLVLSILASAAPSALESKAAAIQEMIEHGDYVPARRAAEALAAQARKDGDRAALGRAYLRLGDALYYSAGPDETYAAYEKALAVFRALDNPGGIAEAYYNLSYRYERRRPRQMIATLDEAQRYAARAADPRLEMKIHNALGAAYWGESRLADALAHVRETRRVAEQLHDARYQAIATGNMGQIEEDRGHHEEALRLLTESLVLYERLGQSGATQRGGTLASVGVVYWSLGDSERATSFYEKALAIHRAVGFKRGQSSDLDGLATLAEELGDRERALALRREALSLSLEAGDERRAVWLMCGLAGSLAAAGRSSEALAHLEDAERRARSNDPGVLLIHVLLSRAQLEREQGRHAEALRWLARAADASRAVGDTLHLADSEGLRAEILEDLGRPAEALAAYRGVVSLQQATHSRRGLHVWHGRMARLHAAAHDDAKAETEYQLSLGLVEDLSAVMASDRFRLRLFEEVAGIYRGYAAWLASRGENERAWQILERGRARVLSLRLLQAGAGAALAPAEQEALDRLSALQKKLAEESLTRDEREQLAASITDAEADYERAQRETGRPPAAAAPPRALAFPAGAVVVEYAFADDQLLVLSHRAGGAVQARQVHGARELSERVGRFISSASSAGAPFAATEARALYRMLLEPELDGLTATRLVLVPDGPLLALPFGALQCAENVFLAERFTLSEAPSLDTLDELRRRPETTAAQAILAVAETHFPASGPDGVLPPLPRAAAEARHVAALAPASTLLVDASESVLKKVPYARFQLVHFATHSVADELHPERSSIVVGPDAEEDGRLQAREIYRMAIPSRLVVVSGCRSGHGRLVAGEGLLGLSHALFAAGARSLLLSRSSVSDDDAAALMNGFYAALPGRSIAEALQETQRHAIHAAGSHPARWAPFFVTGDADQRLSLSAPGHPWAVALAAALAAALIACAYAWRRSRQ